MKKINIRYAGIILMLGMLSVFGCRSDTMSVESVHGTVTLDGQPVEGVSVVFTAKEGSSRPATGRTDEKGTFEMITGGASRNGVMAGDYFVTFSKYILVTPDGSEVKPFAFNPDGSSPEQPPLTKKYLIPLAYSDVNKPLFEAVVERKKKNVYTFDLKSR